MKRQPIKRGAQLRKADTMEKLSLAVLDSNKKPDEAKIDEQLKKALNSLNRKIIVLDDDPTGIQTVHGVSVYTSWDMDAVLSGFKEENSMFFILTNSRGFSSEETVRVHTDIGITLKKAASITGKDYILISRSDSTLRGHYPAETATLKSSIESGSQKRFDGDHC